jgi:GR25 family glycosyltransferase involved in LPS biosynthesis
MKKFEIILRLRSSCLVRSQIACIFCFMSYSVFVINLEHRKDRWLDVKNQEKTAPFSVTRIEALTPEQVMTTSLTTEKVAACWESHKKALRIFIQEELDFALILEDDFQLSKSFLKFSFDEFEKTNLDFLQIGFLRTTIREAFYIRIENLYDLAIRIYGLFEARILRTRTSRKHLVRERIDLGWKFVYADIRPGAHAYIVNKKAALYFLQLNNPIYLSTDDLFMAAAPMRDIRMARLRNSIVKQSGSESSIRA